MHLFSAFFGLIILFIATLFIGQMLRLKNFGSFLLLGFGIGLLMLITQSLIVYFQSDWELDKDDIIGKYEIDKSFYPGKQSDWQHDNFKLEITDSKVYLWRKVNGRFTTTESIKTTWSERDICQKWGYEEIPNHYFFSNKPTLYRSHWDFYYVIKTKCCGNMFFRKE